MSRFLAALIPAALILFTGCEQVGQRLGLEDVAKKEARQDAEGRAVGSACRQSGRAIEDCYAIYYWLPKASIFAGWRDMNDYMLANKLEIVQPRYEPPVSPDEMRKRRKKASADEAAAGDNAADAGKATAKPEGTGEAPKNAAPPASTPPGPAPAEAGAGKGKS